MSAPSSQKPEIRRVLGEYIYEEGTALCDLLNDAGISCIWEDVKEVMISVNAGMATRSPRIKLFVASTDYDKAVDFLKERQKNAYQRVRQESKVTDKMMLGVFIGIVLILFLYVYMSSKGWYSL
jgi:hypothetical protein